MQSKLHDGAYFRPHLEKTICCSDFCEAIISKIAYLV